LDQSIHVPHELVNQTELPVLGFLPFIQPFNIDMKEIWEANENDKLKSNFKKLLNSVRFEVYSEMKDSKLLMVTSLASGEGKTLFSLSLAYSYFMINKKVLLIDGNFESPKIKSGDESALFLDDYLNNKISLQDISKEGVINILSSRGGDISLFELSNEINIKEKLEALKSAYDIVIIEISSLNTLNKAKEWILFAERLIAVFEANQTLSFSKKQQIDYLRILDDKFIGWVMNKTVNTTLLKESQS
jgi:Mrp family chromosome partitioning ATPase